MEGLGGLSATLGRGLYVSLICWPFREKEVRLLVGVSEAMGGLARLPLSQGCSRVSLRLTGVGEGLMTGRVRPSCPLESLELLEYVGPSELLPSPWGP